MLCSTSPSPPANILIYSHIHILTHHTLIHQKFPLRVSQETIDELVGAPGALKCTHYDAYHFFHPKAQEINALFPLSRDSQLEKEQPGCIHATMDLFKFAYKLWYQTYLSHLKKPRFRKRDSFIDHYGSVHTILCVNSRSHSQNVQSSMPSKYTRQRPINLFLWIIILVSDSDATFH